MSFSRNSLPLPPLTPSSAPALAPCAAGSLGFLTPFDVKNFAPTLTRVLAAVEGGPSGGSSAPPPLWVSLRTRKRCDVVDKHGAVTKVHHVFNE